MQASTGSIAVIELSEQHLHERCRIQLASLKPHILQAPLLDLSPDSRSSLAEAAWHVTKMSWSDDASFIVVIRRPDPTQVTA